VQEHGRRRCGAKELGTDVNPNGPIPTDLLAELRAAADRAARGIRDPGVMRNASERMDRMREELRQRTGDLDVAVDLIRDGRDES
jgi:hypothetical protein